MDAQHICSPLKGTCTASAKVFLELLLMPSQSEGAPFLLCMSRVQALGNWITMQGVQSSRKGKVLWKAIDQAVLQAASKTAWVEPRSLFRFQMVSSGSL